MGYFKGSANSGNHNGERQKTAIGYATRKVPVVHPECTVGEAFRIVRNGIEEFDSLDYVYVIDDKKLAGVFSVRKLYSPDTRKKVKIFIRSNDVVSVGPDERPAHAAYLALKHGISAIPVVGTDGTFLGVITKDKILSILHSKHLEDKMTGAGIHRRHAIFSDPMKIPILKSVRFRIFWLFIGLLGGIFASMIIGSFESTLNKNIILAAFLPMVVYMGDAVGTQLEAFSIRDFTLHSQINFSRYFMRQFFIVVVISLLLGLSAFALSLLVYASLKVATTISISIFVAVISSVLTGLLIPFALRKMKKDPATGSGPIGTIIQDILSVFIFFLVASLFI